MRWLLVAMPLLGLTLPTTTTSADDRGVDPPEPSPAPISEASPPASRDCRPGVACSPGSVVSAALVAISPGDAREALVALQRLGDLEEDLGTARDREAELQSSLAACRGAEPDCPAVDVPGWGDVWLGRAGWLMSGVAIGLGVGLWMAVW